MAGRRKSVGPINYHELPRRKLQSLCKKYGFPANKTNVAMADALSALLNAPDRLGMRIDSPAVSSSKGSFYSSSFEIGESPMVSPGVDSLPSISESGPQVFDGLRITRLPEIMEVEPPTEEIAANEAGELSSQIDKEISHTSEVTDMITDNSTPAESVNLTGNWDDRDARIPEEGSKLSASDGNSVEKEAKQIEHRTDLKPLEFSSQERGEEHTLEILDTADKERFGYAIACSSIQEEAGEAEEAELDSNSTPDNETSVCDTFVDQDVTGTRESEDEATISIETVEQSEKLVSTSEVMTGLPIRQPDEKVTEVSNDEVNTVTEPIEVTETCESSAPSSENERNDAQNAPEGMAMDLTTEQITSDGAEATYSTDNVLEGGLDLELEYETVDTGCNTPLPLSVMPHSSPSDLSVSNRDGVRLVVELNKIGFPRIDMFETDGEIKISTHTTDALKAKAASQLSSMQEKEVPRTVQMSEEVYGFKCLNPATLSPRVKRSLGIDIPKIPVSRLPLFTPSKFVPDSEVDTDRDFSFRVQLSSAADASPAPLAPSAACVEAMQVETEKSPEAETASPPVDEAPPESSVQAMDVTGTSEANDGRSDSCSPAPGHVKRILDLIESKSEEKEPIGASRKEGYKQSPIVRSSRIAADVERAAKLGKAKRAAVLAGKRSLWPSTSPPDTEQELQLTSKQNHASVSTDSLSPPRDEGGCKSEGLYHSDPAEATVLPDKSDKDASSPGPTTEIVMAEAFELPQINQTDSECDHSEVQSLPIQFPDVSCAIPDITEKALVVSSTSDSEQRLANEEVDDTEISGEEKKDSTEGNAVGDVSDTPPSDSASGAELPVITYVEVPRPVETNAEIAPISELSWLRKATNLPTPKSQKLSEKVKRPISANLRKFEMMERAALNAAKKHRTPKKNSSARLEVSDAVAASVNGPEYAQLVDMQIGELNFGVASQSLGKTPGRSTSPLGLRDCNKESGAFTLDAKAGSPKSLSPKSPGILSLDAILQENNNQDTGKENQRLRRHQEGYKTPLTGRSKEKALRAAEMNAASLRERILKQRRGIEDDEALSNTAKPLKSSLVGRLL
ncbi:hypothetical protein R1sor_002593 [Riccia sorocarpa]|uniref:Uncharacterized protein n=1 Tax=Riccia sorocarpa TaxID=122646 RepID=A0ABD3H1D3_9MARC